MSPPEVVVGGTTLTFFKGGPWVWPLSWFPGWPVPFVWLLPCCCCWFFSIGSTEDTVQLRGRTRGGHIPKVPEAHKEGTTDCNLILTLSPLSSGSSSVRNSRLG